MHQVDLELAKPGLGDGGVGGDVHHLAGVVEVGEEGVECVERADRHRLGGLAALARARAERDLERAAGIVDQEKLELDRDDRGEAARLVAGNDGAQGVARIALVGTAILAEHPDRQKRGGRLEPGHRQKAAFGRAQHAVPVAGLENERAVVDVLTPNVEIEHGHGEAGAVLDDLVAEARGHAFAPGLAVQVAGSDAEGADLGVFPQVVFHREGGHGGHSQNLIKFYTGSGDRQGGAFLQGMRAKSWKTSRR